MGRRHHLELPLVLLRAARPAEEPDRPPASHVAALYERGNGKRRASFPLRYERQAHGGRFDLRFLYGEGQLRLRDQFVRPALRKGRLRGDLLRAGRAVQGEGAGGSHKRVPFLGSEGWGGVRFRRNLNGNPRQARSEPVPARCLRGDGGCQLGGWRIGRKGRP